MSAPWWLLLASPALALVGVVVGATLPRLFEHRREGQARYDAAISALAREQADRHGAGLHVPENFINAVNSEAQAEVLQELSTDGVRRFLTSAAEARATLATLHPYSPDLQSYWDKFERSQSEMDELIVVLRRRRRWPNRRHAGKVGPTVVKPAPAAKPAAATRSAPTPPPPSPR